MKKELKTSEAINIYYALEEFIQKDIALPTQFTWDLDDNIEVLKNIVVKFEKYRTKLLQPLNDEKAFEQLENGDIKVKNEYSKEFVSVTEEINKYLDTLNEIEIKLIDKKSLPDILSVKDLRALRFMLKTENEC